MRHRPSRKLRPGLERLDEKQLLNAGDKLIGGEIMLWRGRGGKRAEVQHDDVLLFRVDLG